jgi:hypothetical protein
MSELKPCEICGDSECEDAAIQYYIDRCHEAEAALKEKDAEVVRLLHWVDTQCRTIDFLRTQLRYIISNSALCTGCLASLFAELALKEEEEK